MGGYFYQREGGLWAIGAVVRKTSEAVRCGVLFYVLLS